MECFPIYSIWIEYGGGGKHARDVKEKKKLKSSDETDWTFKNQVKWKRK